MPAKHPDPAAWLTQAKSDLALATAIRDETIRRAQRMEPHLRALRQRVRRAEEALRNRRPAR